MTAAPAGAAQVNKKTAGRLSGRRPKLRAEVSREGLIP